MLPIFLLFYSNVSFWFYFYSFVDSSVFFTSSETNLLRLPQTFSWVFAMKSQTDTLQGASILYMESFEAIVMFQCYSDSLVFPLTDSLATNRSITNFLKSTVL